MDRWWITFMICKKLLFFFNSSRINKLFTVNFGRISNLFHNHRFFSLFTMTSILNHWFDGSRSICGKQFNQYLFLDRLFNQLISSICGVRVSMSILLITPCGHISTFFLCYCMLSTESKRNYFGHLGLGVFISAVANLEIEEKTKSCVRKWFCVISWLIINMHLNLICSDEIIENPKRIWLIERREKTTTTQIFQSTRLSISLLHLISFSTSPTQPKYC